MKSGGTLTHRKFSPVIVLLRASSPAAIPRLIVPIVIDSINRHRCIRSAPDISKKRGKAATPFLTHSNSTGAVILVGLHSWIKAAFFYLVPCAIFFGRRLLALLDVLSSFTMFFTSQTTATLGGSGAQGTSKDQCFLAAIAQAKPAQENSAVRALMRYGQSPVATAGQILFFHET